MCSEAKQSLDDQDGAVMVMALFMGIFLCALLFHVMAVGESAVENQLAQDATDSLTFSAAAIKARGMNTIAMFNDIMAIILSILVATRLLLAVVTVAIAALSVACVFATVVCGAIGPLVEMANNLKTVADKYEDSIKPVLRGFETAAEAVNRATPALAEVEAVLISRKESPGVSQIGIVFPVIEELPTEKGEFKVLCGKAGDKVGDTALFFLPEEMGKDAKKEVNGFLNKLTTKFSNYFCGSGGKPDSSMTQDTAYPNNDPACDVQGGLDDNGDCDFGACAECAEKACVQCLPKLNDSSFKKAKWRYTTYTWIETRDAAGNVIETNDADESSAVKWINRNPCEGASMGACGSETLCAKKEEEVLNEYWVNDGSGKEPQQMFDIRVTEVSYKKIHSCVVEEDYAADFGKPASGDDWPKPRRLKEDAKPDDFRVWGVGLAKNSQVNRKTAVGRMYSLEPTGLRIGERVNVASAGFQSPDNDLWSMKWYARMIRFRMPEDVLSVDSCSGDHLSQCSRVMGGLANISDRVKQLMVH